MYCVPWPTRPIHWRSAAGCVASCPTFSYQRVSWCSNASPPRPAASWTGRALAAACQAEWARETELPAAARPATPAEHAIARAWCEVLGRGSVGVEDNFFDAGGNSISALRVHALICQTLGIEFPVTTFFPSSHDPCVGRASDERR